MRGKVLFAVLLLAFVALLPWLLSGRGADPVGTTDDSHLAVNAAAATAPPTAAPVAEPTAAAETAVAERSPAAVEIDLVRIAARWPAAVPAAGVMVHLRTASPGDGYHMAGRARTDRDGRAEFRGLRRGKYEVKSDRGDEQAFTVTGGVQEIAFELAGGIEVTGTVVAPDHRPVAGAAVWLQTADPLWTGGNVLATTGDDGRFALAHVPVHVSLGAFAADFTCSELVDLDVVDTARPPVDVTLQLRPAGGQLEGRVLDAAGAPIADALVALGREDGSYDMVGKRVVEHWSIRSTATDAHGRFACAGLTPGPMPITVRAAGFGFWRSTCAIQAGATAQLTVTMQRSGRVYGIARGADGKPLAGARISCFDQAPRTPFLAGGQIDFEAALGHLTAVAGDDGGYAIDDVTAGTAHLFAQPQREPRSRGAVPYARAELTVAPGAAIEWNPVVEDGRVVEGIVLYRDGQPMSGVFVTLVDEQSNQQHVLNNDRDGVFRFLNLAASTFSARVQYWDAPRGTPALERSGILPDRGRVELRAPFDKPVALAKGSVTGRVDDAGGRIANGRSARMTLMSDQRWFREDGKLEHGAFRFDDVEPCRFRLALMEDEATLACSDWFELQPGAVLDTGVLRTVRAGQVRVTVTREPGTAAAEPKIWFQQDGAPRGSSVPLGRSDGFDVALTPGTYRVTAYEKGMASIEAGVTVREGATTELPLRLQAGRTVRISAWFPAGATATAYRYVVTGADGTVLRERSGQFFSYTLHPWPVILSVPFGEWKLAFTADERYAAECRFAVHEPGEAIELRLDVAAK